MMTCNIGDTLVVAHFLVSFSHHITLRGDQRAAISRLANAEEFK